MLTIYNTQLSTTAETHFSDGLGGAIKFHSKIVLYDYSSLRRLDRSSFVIPIAISKQIKY